MANMRNKWEFYGSILEALGVDYTDAELKNNETLRAKLLEGLGVEHTYDDVNQYPLFREKLIEGVTNYSGGGETWNTVFEGNVTTETGDQGEFAILDGISSLSADTIKVTLNGTEYTLNAYTPEGAPEGVNAYGDLNEGFLITSFNGQVIFRTTEQGTYSLKIEEPQSGGGSSDFSTAKVTIVNNSQSDAFDFIMTIIMTNGGISATTGTVLGTPVGETEVFNVVLYKGNAHIQFEVKESHVVISTSGNISDIGGDNYMVTGDGTITIS